LVTREDTRLLLRRLAGQWRDLAQEIDLLDAMTARWSGLSGSG
jgi:hypothetical protein